MGMRDVSLRYLPVAAFLGVLALLNVVWLRHYAVSTAIAIILYIVVLIVAFFGGRQARIHQWRPGLYGAAIGALFGIIAGLGSFLIRDTLTDINVPAHTDVRLRLLAWANSPSGHIAVVMTAMVAFGVLSLIVGSIGGVSVKESRSDLA
jgi:hypothetical protein